MYKTEYTISLLFKNGIIRNLGFIYTSNIELKSSEILKIVSYESRNVITFKSEEGIYSYKSKNIIGIEVVVNSVKKVEDEV